MSFKLKCSSCGEVFWFYGITKEEYKNMVLKDNKAVDICDICGNELYPPNTF